jgi:hypothetical protein
LPDRHRTRPRDPDVRGPRKSNRWSPESMKKKKEKKSPQKVLLRRYRRIKALIKEINKCLDAKLWYAALVLILILPDICAALESLKGKSEQRYTAWHEKWLMNKYPSVSAQDLWNLRCGMAHQGKPGHRKLTYRVFFTVNSKDGFRIRELDVVEGSNSTTPLKKAKILDLQVFAKDMIAAVEEWYAQKGQTEEVKKNISALIQYYPDGLPPYIDQAAIG